MAQPAWLNKYLTMKPEVNKIFNDLDNYLDWCRFNLEPFDPANLYKENTNWGKFARHTGIIKPMYNKPYNKNHHFQRRR
jgi:hypothetical protein